MASHDAGALSGRAIIVTGGAAGIGAAIVDACLAAGARVLSADLSVTPHRVGVVGTIADVSTASGRESIVAACVAAFGGIDGLVNNAGVNFSKPFLDTTDGDWERVIGVDLKGVFFLTQLAVAHAVSSHKALAVVNISSVHASASCPGAGPYDAAKAGVLGMTRALAVELAAATPSIRVNAVSPGLVATNIWGALLDAAGGDRAACESYWMAQVPQRRAIPPAEVAGPVVFLLSDAAAAVTGANIVADGGMTARLLSEPPFASSAIDGRDAPAPSALQTRPLPPANI